MVIIAALEANCRFLSVIIYADAARKKRKKKNWKLEFYVPAHSATVLGN